MTGLLFPVVCAAPLSKEVSRVHQPTLHTWLNTDSWRGQQIKDRFIEEIGVDGNEWNLAFVDNIDEYYEDASEAPSEVESDPNSPFIRKTPQECHQLLLKLREDTESEIMTDVFAIMDVKSTQDDTVLLVCAERDLGGEHEVLAMQTVCDTFQASATALMLYETGHSSIGEDAERTARERDNVYRGQWSSLL